MKIAPQIDALKLSAREIVAAGVPDASEQMAKSIDEFAAAIEPLIVNDPEPTDHVATLARPFGALIKAVEAVDARQFLLMKGGAIPGDGTVALLKSAVNLVGVALNLMAAEQSAPVESEQIARDEGLGLCKVASDGEEVLLKHSLSEEGMAWIRDPNEAVAEGVSEAAMALELLGLDPARLEKAFGEEEPGDGEPGGDGDNEGGDGTADEGDDNPLYHMAQMGVATMASAGALLDAGGDELSDEVKQALSQLSEAGALIAVQADQLLQMHAAEGADGDDDENGTGTGANDQDGDEPGNAPAVKPQDGPPAKPEVPQPPAKAAEEDPAPPRNKREKAMALAAQSSELIKAARERLGIMNKAAATPAPAAPVAPVAPEIPPARPANAPATKLVGLTKSQDGGGTSAEQEQAELLEKLAAMPEEKRQQELIKISLRGSPTAAA